MCKKVEGSGQNAVVIWTVSPPYKKGSPGFVASATQSGYEGEVLFTSNIWFAATYSRAAVADALTAFRRRTDKALYTHDAVAQLVVAK
jgi:hypothetical protein